MKIVKRNANWLDPFDFFTDVERNLESRQAWKDLKAAFSPDLDLQEKEKHYEIHLDVPGVKKEDIDISLEDRILTLRGSRTEHKEEHKKGVYHSERRFGEFTRHVELPTEVDETAVKATYKDGVLEVIVPKSPKATPKKIEVQVK